MKIKHFKKATLLGGILFLSILMISQLAWTGQNRNNNATKPELLIKKVIVKTNPVDGTLYLEIIGVNFDNGDAPPVVTLGDDPTPLNATLVSSTEIHAELPDPLEPGDRLLAVSTRRTVREIDEYNLTLGAVDVQRGIDCPEGHYMNRNEVDGKISCVPLLKPDVCDTHIYRALPSKNAMTSVTYQECSKGFVYLPQTPSNSPPGCGATAWCVPVYWFGQQGDGYCLPQGSVVNCTVECVAVPCE